MKFNYTIIVIIFFFSTTIRASEVVAKDNSITTISSTFLDKPYQLDPLGEENAELDNDPLIRFDVFDCQTFVETVLAIKMSSQTNEWKSNLIKIRYKNNVISFLKRNHFIELDWLNNNVFFKNITEEIFTTNSLSTFKTTISLNNFFKYHNIYEKLPQKEIDVSLKSVPLSVLLKNDIINQIPNESIILIAHKNYYNKKFKSSFLISHMGFLIFKNNKPYLRHAARKDKVKDSPFKEYLLKNFGTSKYSGIVVLKFNK